ncbi:alpha/beta hydrolase family protein [Amycolatopsis sp. NPDC059027]|uniref:alpha/beta hydrolase family protein n=1 Tax=Amycolatopsis sp. NPDC059027 TaxID=3346709 RepID=UPI00367031CB
MRLRTLAMAGILAVGLTTTGVANAATVSAALPRPTGHHKVGLSTFQLTDTRRADPWVPAQRRELMVSLWYPARSASGQRAKYMTPQESTALGTAAKIPADFFAGVDTNSTVDAPALGRKAPLVVLSPGFLLPRNTLTSLAEELASRGYVVAGIGHNYEALATSFPDGHTTGCEACAVKDWTKLVDTRAADTSFVLDELTGPRSPHGVARLIDASRIAMVGHSIGGSSTAPAMLGDPRIGAGVIVDGKFYTPVTGLNRPYLLLGKPEHLPGGTWDPTWDTGWPELGGWKRWLTVDKSDHNTFTDANYLAAKAGFPMPDDLIEPLRGIRITEAYVTAFLDQHLRGHFQPLLCGPSPRYPEVRFWNP